MGEITYANNQERFSARQKYGMNILKFFNSHNVYFLYVIFLVATKLAIMIALFYHKQMYNFVFLVHHGY